MCRHVQWLVALFFLASSLQGETVQSVGGNHVLRFEGGIFVLHGPEEAQEALTLPRTFRPRDLIPAEGSVWIAGSATTEMGAELQLWRAGGGEVQRIQPPPSEAALRVWPTLRVRQGRLTGMAWLEGASTATLSVRAARAMVALDGTVSWGAIETVSTPGPGTQLALRSTSLTDGSWLLVWSAFDGEDDEIVWARRSSEGWSPVARLHDSNGVPDIVPNVVTLGAGAVASWSRFDGEDYRLKLARFSESGWEEVPWQGQRGSSFPTFTSDRQTGGARVLYQAALPRGWYVLELAANAIGFGWWTPSEQEARPSVRSDGVPLLSWTGAPKPNESVQMMLLQEDDAGRPDLRTDPPKERP